MEGPSLYLAAEQLKPFKKRRVLGVAGNTKTPKDSVRDLIVKDIFAWGKHLVFQFDEFAIRIHFLLFGTFEASVDGTWVTGDYRKAREPRLAFTFENGTINMYNCSVKFIKDARAKKSYDFSIDIMSRQWNPSQALKHMKLHPDEEIADVLLDQEIFAGVGNIIKNEVLSIVHLAPERKIADIPRPKLVETIAATRAFSKQFLRWRRKFVLKKHLKVHRKSVCPYCGGKLVWKKTGKRQRWAHWCPIDQI